MGTEDFVEYEQDVYEKYQENAECEIIEKLNALLSNTFFLMILKQWSAQCACRFLGYREIKCSILVTLRSFYCVENATHYEVYEGEKVEIISQKKIEWFKKYLVG